jgi:hypothetical protein
MTLVSEVVSSLMTWEAAAGFGAGAGFADGEGGVTWLGVAGVGVGAVGGCADGEDGVTWLGVAGVGVGFLPGAGVGFTCGLGAGLGAGLACGAGEPAGRAPPAAGDGLVALKLFQFTQPVMATAATMRRGVWCFIVGMGWLLDNGLRADDLLDNNFGVEERFGDTRRRRVGDVLSGAIPRCANTGLAERPRLEGILDGNFLATVADMALGGSDDVLVDDLERHFAGAIRAVFDGGGSGALDECGQGRLDFIALRGEITDRRSTADLDAHDALGELAVGIDFRRALGQDFFLSFGAGQGGVALHVDVFLARLLRPLAIGADLDLPGGKLGVLDHGVEALDDILDAHRTHQFHATIVEEFGLADSHNTRNGGLHSASDLIILQSEIINRGVSVDLNTEDPLDEQAVAVELGGAHGLETFARAGLLPDGRKRGTRTLFRTHGGERGGGKPQRAGEQDGEREVMENGCFHATP